MQKYMRQKKWRIIQLKKILIITGRYLPGYKDGGPLRTIINVTEALGDEYNFHIMCWDRE